MRLASSLFPILASITLLSCSEEKQAEDPPDEMDFFAEVDPSLSLDDLKNELATSESSFLRSFADDEIKWQKWDKSILEKSKNAQLPIFAFVGSALGGSSKLVAEKFTKNEKLRLALSQQAICTVIDINIHPEIATLGFHLNTEIRRTTAFPMLIWFSHEGSPIAGIPIGNVSGQQLDIIVNNATSMVEDIWGESSRYAVEDSRHNNSLRQKRFNLERDMPEPEPRDEIFRRETRQLSSLHSSEEQDLDSIGGLIPYSSLELLAIGSRSNLLTKEVRERCRSAAQSVAKGLMHGAVKDQLDGSYFYARRTSDWSLPNFAKSISPQAKIASMFFKIGGILDDDELNTEALNLLALIESDWLQKEISHRSPIDDMDISGSFLWNFGTLREVITTEELALATIAFSLDKSGNIPTEVDPLGNYFRLNSLTNLVSIPKIAAKIELSEDEVTTSLTQIKKKLLAHREKNTRFFTENALIVSDLASILDAQVARASHSGEAAHLETAEATADRILKDYWVSKQGLIRLKYGETDTPARGADYMEFSLALIHLYQFTLNDRWFSAALEITEHAIETLGAETELIAETPPKERIIPLRQHNISMIFGESTLGLADAAVNRLHALTNKERFRSLLDKHAEIVDQLSKNSPVNHTDFLVSCALGEAPLIAVLQGDAQSTTGKSLLSLLNSPKHLSFLTIRPEVGNDQLSPLPEIPSLNGEASVVLIRKNQSLGQASTPEKLTELLDSIISGK